MNGLLRMNEVAKSLNCGIARAYSLRVEDRDSFPKPAMKIGNVLFWRRSDVERYARQRLKRA